MAIQDSDEARRYFAQKLAFTTGPFDVQGMIARGEPVTVIDVREPTFFRQGHVPGAINLPRGKWHTAVDLPKDQLTVFYCYSDSCKLAAQAALFFADRGTPVMELDGGYPAWVEYGFPTETSLSAAS
jgi:rhodanese-related sulfurtransferase